jgi:hypothetical protein
VKPGVAVLAAGGAFAALTVCGLGIGILVAERTGRPLWALGGLFAGAAIGAYSAIRLLFRATQ